MAPFLCGRPILGSQTRVSVPLVGQTKPASLSQRRGVVVKLRGWAASGMTPKKVAAAVVVVVRLFCEKNNRCSARCRRRRKRPPAPPRHASAHAWTSAGSGSDQRTESKRDVFHHHASRLTTRTTGSDRIRQVCNINISKFENFGIFAPF